MRRARTAIIGAAIAALASGPAYAYLTERRDRRRFPAPGELVDIGGRRLHIVRTGGGKPTVMVLPALGASAIEWIHIQQTLAARTDATVVLIDRGGIGWSDPAPWPRTPHTAAADLDKLITVLGTTGPLILVGHSVGGLAARLYAAGHRDRVAGLVLIDSSHEDQWRVLPRFDPSVGIPQLWARAIRRQLQPLGLAYLRRCLGRGIHRQAAEELPGELAPAHRARGLAASSRRAVVQELLGFAHGMSTVRTRARDLGDLPITVVTGGSTGRERYYEGWTQLQADLLRLSTNTIQIPTLYSSHQVHRDNPDLVVQVIHDAIARAQPRTPEV
jgi:pimeloyl-ACP methyl ester carboxylesterase